MFHKKYAALAAVALMALSTTACTQGGGINNQGVGVVGGALAGGLIGNQFGRGGGRVAATLAGAAIGGLIGGGIGASLDEQDRQRAYGAQNSAFATGRPTRWRGDNAYGEIEPGPVRYSGAGYCREYSHTIYVGGRPQRGYGQACRQPDGSWQIVS
jgi:surface antigen